MEAAEEREAEEEEEEEEEEAETEEGGAELDGTCCESITVGDEYAGSVDGVDNDGDTNIE